ncbi:glycosyltransferase [Beijerinckia indica]|uniref:Glycosyl transferase family 2 n=1 Tax=Beijerinckia indica subsp. indica (strain ATCC 9039 / DSM 1715 / NCIMB 8712) TaxID=395963 RepID=B2IBZ4_BEII9|nr:glycosyltransferase [Beijerinckia indica]ACB95249.1 glycosyl transferase family 2 [Beijerinckia indica subsp. indica ATCC 9039]
MTHYVSVVIPCYNAANTIGECLSSLEAQTYPREFYEIIVADNGSTDGCLDLIRQKFPQVRIVQAVQKGSGYARNAGIEAAEGQLIASIDADCVADSKWIATLVEAIERVSDEVAAIGGMIEPYSYKTTIEHFEDFWIKQENLRQGKGLVRYAETPNAIFRIGPLRVMGGFDGTMGFDDADLGIRLQKAGFRIEFAPGAIVKHRNPSTWHELFRHRRKYGAFNFKLAQKYPELLGDVTDPRTARRVQLETIRRVCGGIVIKFPLALLTKWDKPSRLWPLADAVAALANYLGYRDAYVAFQRSSHH